MPQSQADRNKITVAEFYWLRTLKHTTEKDKGSFKRQDLILEQKYFIYEHDEGEKCSTLKNSSCGHLDLQKKKQCLLYTERFRHTQKSSR